MNLEELKTVIENHKLWLNDDEKGIKANLSRANLRGADLSGADLRGADLRGADLSYADLSYADLSYADLSGADLRGADLSGANLSGADLRGADLSGADLRGADLRGADLSGAVGLFSPSKWFNENFTKVEKGYIVYKAIGNTHYSKPDHWVISGGSFIEDNPNPVVTVECGCGVNFGTLNYVEKNFKYSDIWECILLFEDMPSLVIPYNTDGKCRCGRLQLLRKL